MQSVTPVSKMLSHLARENKFWYRYILRMKSYHCYGGLNAITKEGVDEAKSAHS